MARKKIKKVYIAYTGGTIGMVSATEGHVNKKKVFTDFINNNELIQDWITANKTQIYINEYIKLIDSSNITPLLWWDILRDIKRQYSKFDGFIIVHGTDTLAYTSSILSFLIEENHKPIVITGAQRPIFQEGSDGIANMLNSIKIASGQHSINEVCVVFGNSVLRGARVTKVSALNDNAFASPQSSKLANISTNGINPNISLTKSVYSNSFKFSDIRLGKIQVAVVKIFPGFIAKQLVEITNARIKGIVIEAYGLGTAPNDEELIHELSNLKELEIPVVIVSQPLHGYVKLSEYESSSVFRSTGAVSGYDMTTEAAVTKLYYLINQQLSYKKIKQLLRKNLRGELSTKMRNKKFEIISS